MKLAKALKIGYMSKEKQEKKMGKRGYERDNELSSGDHQAYYNPKTKKLLFNVKGTDVTSIKDWITDGYLAAGHIKETSRFREADKMLKKAKQKYKPVSTSVIGHSLGSSIGSLIASKTDKVTTLDGGYTIGQKTRSNNKAYRTDGDAVSILGANNTNMTTLKNDNKDKFTKLGNNYAGISGAIAGKLLDAYQAHDINNIKNEKIFV
jgi:hypothetical protein